LTWAATAGAPMVPLKVHLRPGTEMDQEPVGETLSEAAPEAVMVSWAKAGIATSNPARTRLNWLIVSGEARVQNEGTSQHEN
jgi:hypothetical protein